MDFSNTSDILSLIAIIVSLVSAAYQWNLDIHMNKVNLEADSFKILFSKHLLYDLPIARTYLRFDNDRLVDTDLLLDEINLIRQDALYFMYSDKDFYTDIKIKLQDFEDYLINTENESLNQDKQEEVFKEISNKLEMIYKTFNDKYIGS